MEFIQNNSDPVCRDCAHLNGAQPHLTIHICGVWIDKCVYCEQPKECSARRDWKWININ